MNLFLYAPGWVGGSTKDTVAHNRVMIAEPDYTRFIPPMQLRRMSKAVRMGIAAARMSLQHTTLDKPDAISIGTAMGCLQDTETFLSKMVEQQEQMLPPTAFIQSTHNTVAGQIALVLGCMGHNLTFTQRGLSTEHALLNAWLYLQQHPEETVLAGGIDELTDSSYALLERAGVYECTPAGEGAGFFLASLRAPEEQPYLRLKHLFQCTGKTPEEAAAYLSQQLDKTKTVPQLLLSGQTGNASYAAFYDVLKEQYPTTIISLFKKGAGEFATAVALAIAQLLQNTTIKPLPAPELAHDAVKNIVVWNNYLDSYSCWVLSDR